MVVVVRVVPWWGLAERVLTEAQAAWPLAVVLTCWRSVSPARVPPAAPAR
jgi:hypothetical protein